MDGWMDEIYIIIFLLLNRTPLTLFLSIRTQINSKVDLFLKRANNSIFCYKKNRTENVFIAEPDHQENTKCRKKKKHISLRTIFNSQNILQGFN